MRRYYAVQSISGDWLVPLWDRCSRAGAERIVLRNFVLENYCPHARITVCFEPELRE